MLFLLFNLLTGNENCPASDFSLLDHLCDDSRRSPGPGLPDQSLGDRAWIQAVIQTQTPDVRVGANALDPGHGTNLGHLCRRRED